MTIKLHIVELDGDPYVADVRIWPGYGKGTYREGVTENCPLEQVNVQIKQDIFDLHVPHRL